MKKTNFKCMYLVDDFLYNKVIKDNQNPQTWRNTFIKTSENIPHTIISNKKNDNIYKYETSHQHKPELNSVSNTTDIVSTSSLGLNREIENTSLPSLPTSPTPYNSTSEPILTSTDCDCLEPNKSTSTLNKKNFHFS